MRKPDKEILELLNTDPQHGMYYIVKNYTGLLWKIGEYYLENAEDIKECINDTFTDFYMQRERFDQNKGTLAAYLSEIMRKKAISTYRKNRGRKTEVLDETISSDEDLFRNIENKIDVEKLLESLKEEELLIIRMKYYENMTVQEIADSLNLPYETVKKRHQRSLSKMRRLLLPLLIFAAAALLTACAISVLRHFGILPEYGINENKEERIYGLKEKVSIENQIYTLSIDNAYYINGELIVQSNCYPKNMTVQELMQNESPSITEKAIIGDPEDIVFSPEYPDSQIQIYNNVNVVRQKDGKEYLGFDFNAQVTNPPEDEEWKLILKKGSTELEFILEEKKAEKIEPYIHQTEEGGGVLMIPRRENEELILSIYPLNTGKYKILPSLIYGIQGENSGEQLTITDSEGTTYEGTCMNYFPNSSVTFFDWNFGKVAPGDYTLHIPYLQMKSEMTDDTKIHIDLEKEEWDDKTLEAPGATVSILSCEKLDVEYGDPLPFNPEISGPKQALKGGNYYLLKLKTEMHDENYQLMSIMPVLNAEYAEGWDETSVLPEANAAPEEQMLWAATSSVSLYRKDLDEGITEYLLQIREGVLDPSQATISLTSDENSFIYELGMVYKESFELPFTVK